MLVTIKRAFLVRGERQEPGATVELADDLAREMIALGKVEPVDALPRVSGPMSTESAAGLVGGRKRKG